MRYRAWVCDICGKPMDGLEASGTKIKLYKQGPLDFVYHKQDMCGDCFHKFIEWCREESDKKGQKE